MAEELKYTSEYDGATTDDLLGYSKEAKEVGVNAYVKESKELKSNEYVRSMKEQLAAEDAETVQVYDVEGVPHKITKKELISKAGIQLPSLEEIGGFVAYDTNGQALGLMSKEQVAKVVGGLIPVATESLNGLYNKDWFMPRRIDDCNEANTGIYKNTSKNKPSSESGLLVSWNYENEKVQLFFTHWPFKIYGRIYWDSWGDWLQLG